MYLLETTVTCRDTCRRFGYIYTQFHVISWTYVSGEYLFLWCWYWSLWWFYIGWHCYIYFNLDFISRSKDTIGTPEAKRLTTVGPKRLCICGRFTTLHWRHNDHDGVSNHQPHGCLLNRLFRRRSKETSKLHVTGLCVGNSPESVNSPHKGPVTRKMFPFDDVIMQRFFIWYPVILRPSWISYSSVEEWQKCRWSCYKLQSNVQSQGTKYLISVRESARKFGINSSRPSEVYTRQ